MNSEETRSHRAFALPGSALQYGPDKRVDVKHIDLYLVPDLQAQRLEGVCTTTVCAFDEEISELVLDAVDLQISEVKRDGATLAFVRRGDHLAIAFDPPIAAGAQATFSVAYFVDKPQAGLFFIAPDAHYPDKISHAWTQSQDENARYWLPCFDYPHEKQTTSTTVVVPRGLFALANGALVERKDDGDTTIFRYRQDVAHSTYLLTMVVGPFVEVEQRGGERPVLYYVLPGREADGERSFGKTPNMIDVFESRLDCTYPYARYSQIAVSDFIFGGMENTSATTQTDRTLHDERAHADFSSDPLVAHELAHQWFGDLLTCRDWSHAWLNEGFATFFEAVFREADLGSDEYLYDIFGCVERYLEEDSDRYRRPIVWNTFRDPIELFDRHLYEKGGAVLHMLRGELGESRFWRSMQRYVRDNAGRNVETIDLIRAIESATGRNLRGFFDRWVFRGGHPELKVALSWDRERRSLTVTVDQKQACDAENPAFEFDVELGLALGESGAEKRMSIAVRGAHETLTIPLEREPSLVRFDPGAFILAKVETAFGVHFAAAALRGDANPIARIYAALELIKDASREAREAMGEAFAHERFWGVLAEACAALGATRAPWARELLLGALRHDHPKVRRAAAHALGSFKNDREVASALLAPAQHDSSYFVQSAALEALGKSGDARAFDVLIDALGGTSWNATVQAGAAHGLAELADERSADALLAVVKSGHEEHLRRAALSALARLAERREDRRTLVLENIHAALDEPMFLLRISAIAALERLADPRSVAPLTELADGTSDGRLRRDAMEAIVRIRENQKVPAQVTGLRSDLDRLREDQQKLQAKLESISGT